MENANLFLESCPKGSKHIVVQCAWSCWRHAPETLEFLCQAREMIAAPIQFTSKRTGVLTEWSSVSTWWGVM
jgi:hypothetical protein